MIITVDAGEGHVLTVVNPVEIRIQADEITLEASHEDGHQIYVYKNRETADGRV